MLKAQVVVGSSFGWINPRKCMSLAVLVCVEPWLPRASRDDRCVILLLTATARPVLAAFTLSRQSVVNWFRELAEEHEVERQRWRESLLPSGRASSSRPAADTECRLWFDASDSDPEDRYYYCGIEVDRNYLECND